MEHQKVMSLLDNTPNQSTKFRTRNWFEKNDESRRTYSANLMLRSSLCDYSYVYMLVSATITVPNTVTAANPNNRKNIIIKNGAPFTNCMREINNTQIGDAKDIDIVRPMYSLL